MAQHFLGSVGVADIFTKVGDELKHFATARTLSDSALNISVSAEEVRGGEGAQLHGQFFHTSVFGLTLTDTMFNIEYIAAQIGGEVNADGNGYGATVETTTGSGTTYTLKEEPIPLVPGTKTIAWVAEQGKSDFQVREVADGAIGELEEGTIYCVRYFASKAAADKLIVEANFVPKELVVMLTTKLYAGESTSYETGKAIGEVTVKIPRFQLDGSVDLSMAMTSTAPVSLNGTALAYSEGCEGARYAEIVQLIYSQTLKDRGYTKLVADASAMKVGDTPIIYAVGFKVMPKRIDNGLITFAPVLVAGKIDGEAGGTQKFEITKETAIKGEDKMIAAG